VRAAIDGTLSDIRYAWRVLRRSPGFTFFAVLTIALGLGANAAIFSLVDGVLLKSIGYPHPERIVLIWEKPPGGLRNGIAAANYIDWRQQSHSFEAMAATTGATMSYSASPSSSSASGEPRSLRVGVVSAPYFDVFGVQAALGRTFARNEDQRGHEKVTVLSHRLWLNLFGADPAIVGHDILLNGEPYTVIGVMPANSEFDRRASDLWIPLAFPPQVARDYHFLSAVARLKPDVSFQQAQAEMSAIAARIAELYPAVKKGWGATVDRYVDRIVGPQMRLSLTVLLSSIGAVLGIGFGYLLLRGIQSLLPPFYFPAEANVGMDGRVLVFLAAVTILTSVGFGLSPAVQASRQSTAEALKEGGRASSAGRRALYTRHVFVALQVAIAFILLAGAGVLIRSFQRVMNVDTGYNIEGMVAAYLPLSSESDPNVAQLTQYIQQILDEVRAIPGVREAAVATAIPLRGWGDGMPFRMASKPDEEVGTGFKIVTPRYFQTLGLRLVAGRLLDDRDTAGSMPVVVVNESFVRRYSPNDSAIGQQILVEKILPSRRGLGPRVAWEIVGVVADEKGSGLENPTDVGAYASFAQNPVVGLGLVARGSGEGGALIKSMQRAVWRVNKTQVLDRPMTVEQLKSDSMSGRRLPTMLLSGFAVLAMLLACAGIYGVLSFVTAKRTQELGIRAALGASRWDLLRMVVGGGAIPVLAGIAVGLGGAVALSRFIESLLFQTSPIDVPSLAAVAVVFLAIALTACLVPAWRAARIDPMSALRQE
jgi:putative ABC transport system permease protein